MTYVNVAWHFISFCRKLHKMPQYLKHAASPFDRSQALYWTLHTSLWKFHPFSLMPFSAACSSAEIPTPNNESVTAMQSHVTMLSLVTPALYWHLHLSDTLDTGIYTPCSRKDSIMHITDKFKCTVVVFSNTVKEMQFCYFYNKFSLHLTSVNTVPLGHYVTCNTCTSGGIFFAIFASCLNYRYDPCTCTTFYWHFFLGHVVVATNEQNENCCSIGLWVMYWRADAS